MRRGAKKGLDVSSQAAIVVDMKTPRTDRRVSGYTPEEQIEIARDEAAARAAQEAKLAAWLLGCECGDAEGEAY